jgi:hypothetical protein
MYANAWCASLDRTDTGAGGGRAGLGAAARGRGVPCWAALAQRRASGAAPTTTTPKAWDTRPGCAPRITRGARRAAAQVKAQIVDAVDEFAGRLFEESDYANEARPGLPALCSQRSDTPSGRVTLRLILAMTSVEALTSCGARGGQARNILLFKQLYNQTYDVVVPAVVPEGSHGRVLSLEWINGTKLVEPGNADVDPADLPLLSLGIQFTLAQCVRTPWGFLIRRQFDRLCCTPAVLQPRCVRRRGAVRQGAAV